MTRSTHVILAYSPLNAQPTIFTWAKTKNIINFKVKTHYKGAKNFVTLYCFLGVPCSNFNHVIIMSDFHNVFAFYDSSNPNKLSSKETTLFNLI
jgi:hypothetical protein